jgi:hypothetical protein
VGKILLQSDQNSKSCAASCEVKPAQIYGMIPQPDCVIRHLRAESSPTIKTKQIRDLGAESRAMSSPHQNSLTATLSHPFYMCTANICSTNPTCTALLHSNSIKTHIDGFSLLFFSLTFMLPSAAMLIFSATPRYNLIGAADD